MVLRSNPAATRRVQLTRATVLRAAVALADQSGLDVLTMRKLGESLEVEAMSLYNHVANKEDLLDGMIDLVFDEIDVPFAGDWMPAMRLRAVSLRDVLVRHRWAIGVMDSRRNPGPANLRHHDAVLQCLRTAGFSIELAAHAYSLMDSYIYGFAQTQLSLPFDEPEHSAVLAQEMLEDVSMAQYPSLAEMLAYATRPEYDHGREFEFGLDVVLKGIRMLRPSPA